MAPQILKILQAFRKYIEPRNSKYPIYFCEWGSHMGMTLDEYNKIKAEDEFGGGEFEAWLSTIDEMIFAFEFNLYHDSFDKKQKKFYQKWNILDPFRETEDNLSWGYNFRNEDGDIMSCGEHDLNRESIEERKKEGRILESKQRDYIDLALRIQYRERANEGMRLFGKFFWNLWD